MLNPSALPVQLAVESTGRGEPLVLLHGWALHGGLFAGLAQRLAARFRVHAVDLPGHGHSAPLAPWTLDGAVAALERAFAAEPRPLTVLGWSFGGLVALAWAQRAPARIARLALVGATPRFVAAADWPHGMAPATLASFGADLGRAWKPTLQRFLALQVQGGEHGRETLATLRAGAFSRGVPEPRSLRDSLEVLAATDLRAGIAGIRVPALVLAGDRDTIVAPEAGRWLAGALPVARFAHVAGAAHAPFLSHPDAFGRTLAEFLDERRTALHSA